ncbi:hypothetical protein KC19_2G261400 [Ceratodon purpureus]|uniref:Uncharacterized protein n=1 Tax=Ceratodon purpureus TaxID=3225 RepID=A0A8T0J1Z0_CERPU|nr:hypothetical protein KC19_2G261400 [Ceratodon purpureus]
MNSPQRPTSPKYYSWSGIPRLRELPYYLVSRRNSKQISLRVKGQRSYNGSICMTYKQSHNNLLVIKIP